MFRFRILLVIFTLSFGANIMADAKLVSADIASTLDRFHAAAASANLDVYLSLLTEDAVFLGTDSTERWQGAEFRSFVTGHFSAGNGWTYRSVERHIELGPDDRTAWFDELLDNEQLGRCRGSGVLVSTATGWRISQYNLSVPIPNSIVAKVAAEISALEQ
jgi:hypothetical protein